MAPAAANSALTGGPDAASAPVSGGGATVSPLRPRPRTDIDTTKSASLLGRFPAVEANAAEALSLSVLVPVYNERHFVETSLRRLLAIESPLIRSLEVIVVDDHSRDGSWDIIQRLADTDPRVRPMRHEKNRGKGAALRTGLAHATGDVTVVHDADLEYNPADIPSLLVPFIREGADAVFGSRYLSAQYRRALMYRHTLINSALTFASSFLTDLHLTDIETCYKAVRTPLLKSIPLRSDDFRCEIEIPFKLAKRRARIFEVPIRYLPRTYEEGKKIRAKDGLLALAAIAKYRLIDDLYHEDSLGGHILRDVESSPRYSQWLAHAVRPHLGFRVLELGAGAANLTSLLIPRDAYVVADSNPVFLEYLRSYSFGKPYLRVVEIRPEIAQDFATVRESFDTVVLANVLETLEDDASAVRNAATALEPGGRMVVVVPQGPDLFGELDRQLGHRRRYTREALDALLRGAGFAVERIDDFNRGLVGPWRLSSRLAGRARLSRPELKLANTLVPVLEELDGVTRGRGLSLVAVAVKK
jgi:glycosyltransferase involved in cell wall biosynthesis